MLGYSSNVRPEHTRSGGSLRSVPIQPTNGQRTIEVGRRPALADLKHTRIPKHTGLPRRSRIPKHTGSRGHAGSRFPKLTGSPRPTSVPSFARPRTTGFGGSLRSVPIQPTNGQRTIEVGRRPALAGPKHTGIPRPSRTPKHTGIPRPSRTPRHTGLPGPTRIPKHTGSRGHAGSRIPKHTGSPRHTSVPSFARPGTTRFGGSLRIRR
ncbi:hypothetical protein [Arthrobacter sp. yr096]|uniref:hypothetical protein n=1 Tax=Arthrobacter sp. yr096 TaxID=1761750 RepID=UPI00115FD539|nr:hypothetical protein [Arthrobacter sp. yr096]